MKTYKIFLIIVAAGIILPSLVFAKGYNLAAEELFAFGQVFLRQERFVEARHEFQKCLMLNPGHKQAKKLLNLCEEKIAPKEKAIFDALEKLEEAKELKAESPPPAPAPEVITEEARPTGAAQEKDSSSLAPPIQIGAWTLKKGKLYTELYTKYYWHNHQFNNNRKKKRWDFNGKGDEIMTELKLEYGLTDSDTLLLSTVAKEAHWKDNFTSNTRKGFTEVKPGIKHLLFTDPFIGSLQLKVKFPLHYSEQAVPALSTHQIDVETKFLTAQPWPKLPGYTKFETGFRFRAEEQGNEIPYFSELGYNLNESTILKTTIDGQVGVGGGRNEDWTKYTVGPIFKIKDLFNIEFGYGHTFAGRNSSAAKEVFTTFSRHW